MDLETGPAHRLLGVPVEVLVRQGDRRGPVGDLGGFELLALLEPGPRSCLLASRRSYGVANSL